MHGSGHVSVEDDGRPALVIVSGLPGAGKTTLAKQIAAERPAVRFSPDDWLAALGHGIWDGEARERIEQLQKLVASDVLRSGASVVIEWGTWAREERDILRDLARSLGARAELMILDPPVETLYERVTLRAMEDPPITLDQLRGWDRVFQRADQAEGATYDRFEYLS
jgi:predicted kinase